MTFTLAGFWQLSLATVTDPRSTATRILQMNLSMPALWMMLALVAVLSALLSEVNTILLPPPVEVQQLLQPPLVTALLLACVMVITVISLTWGGRAVGGTGSLRDVLALIVWLQAVWLLVQLALLLVVLVIPVLSSLLGLAAFGVMLWVLVTFIDEAHHLNSMFKAVGVLFLGLIGIVIGLVLLSSLFGIAPVGSGYV